MRSMQIRHLQKRRGRFGIFAASPEADATTLRGAPQIAPDTRPKSVPAPKNRTLSQSRSRLILLGPQARVQPVPGASSGARDIGWDPCPNVPGKCSGTYVQVDQ